MIIKRSCITGQIVWVYRGLSSSGAVRAYRRVRRVEMKRVRQWHERIERKRRAIAQLLNDCLAAIPLTAQLTSEQQAAVHRLKAISEEPGEYCNDFYNHIIEECQRSNTASRRWREYRERTFLSQENNEI